MYPAPIDEYVRPATVSDALAALGRYDDGDAMFVAGGQSLMQAVKSRLLRPRCLIDLQAIEGLSGIDVGSGGVRIGPMTRYVEIAVTSGWAAPAGRSTTPRGASATGRSATGAPSAAASAGTMSPPACRRSRSGSARSWS